MNAISKKLDLAKLHLRNALAHSEHSPECAFRKFRAHNSYLPPTHPAWKSAPGCSCWVGDAETFLNLN